MRVWEIIPAPLWHGGFGIWDEVISWGVFLIVAVVVGAFFYQQWQERDAEDDLESELPQDPVSSETKDDHS
jgi:hypothetical protein